MRHFFVDKTPKIGGSVPLDLKDSDHLLRVLRASEGDALQIASEEGIFRGTLHIEGNRGWVKIDEKIEIREKSARLILAQGVGKNQKTETVLKHATECGIDGFIPVQTDRSVSNLAKKYGSKKQRFEKIAAEAAKQSNRAHIPVVGDLLAVDALLDRIGAGKLVVCYEGEEDRDLLDLDVERGRDIYLLIGAEGGFSDREVKLLKERGASFVTMGPTILRTETAGVVASYVLARLMERGRR